MGIRLEVLYTKDTPYGEMLSRIEELAIQQGKDDEWLVPLPFLERVIETRGLTVLQYAVIDLIELFMREDMPKLNRDDMRRLHEMRTLNSLDKVWVIAHEMAAEPNRNPDAASRVYHREEAQRIQDFLNKRTPAKNSVQDLDKQLDILGESRMDQSFDRVSRAKTQVTVFFHAHKEVTLHGCLVHRRTSVFVPGHKRVEVFTNPHCHPARDADVLLKAAKIARQKGWKKVVLQQRGNRIVLLNVAQVRVLRHQGIFVGWMPVVGQ